MLSCKRHLPDRSKLNAFSGDVLCGPPSQSSDQLTAVSQKGKKDAVNFDAEFTKEEPNLTPINADIIKVINQTEFDGFSFVNADYGCHRM